MSAAAPPAIVDTPAEAARLERPPLLVRRPLEALLDAHGLGSGPVDAVPIGEGHSNITYRITRGDKAWVLRRPPRPPLPPSAHDVLREHRLLAALGDAPPSLLAFADRALVVELATRARVPTMFPYRQQVDLGGLMSYGVDVVDNFRRAASFVDRILKGAKPADLPVERPTKFELVINLKTAKALGLTIPPSVLGRADQVIE